MFSGIVREIVRSLDPGNTSPSGHFSETLFISFARGNFTFPKARPAISDRSRVEERDRLTTILTLSQIVAIEDFA